MRKFIQNKPFLASMILNLGLFLVFFTIFYSRYGTTDDVEMQMVLSGKGVLQDPSAYLRWTHIYIGYLLSTLYSYLPSIPWYGLYLSFAHLLGMTAILYSILILKTNLFRLSFFVLCFILGESALLQDLQFTSSALVLQTGAVFLLYTAISNPIDKRRNQWYIIAFIMLIFGSMMRWSTLELIVVLSTPLLLYAIFQQNKKRLFNVVFCVSILLTAYGLNKIHYSIQNQVKGWAIFNEYKVLLTGPDILDYNKPQYKWTATTADDYFYKVGWEYEDLMLFKHWFFADSSVFGLKQFQALKNSFQNCPYPEEHIQERLWQFFIEMPLNDYVFYGFLVLGIVLMLIKGNRWSYLLIISSLLLVIAILASLFVYKHLPERVSYPIAFYLICLGALFITYDKEIQRNTKFYTLFAIGIMAISNLKMVTNESSKTAFAKMHWTVH